MKQNANLRTLRTAAQPAFRENGLGRISRVAIDVPLPKRRCTCCAARSGNIWHKLLIEAEKETAKDAVDESVGRPYANGKERIVWAVLRRPVRVFAPLVWNFSKLRDLTPQTGSLIFVPWTATYRSQRIHPLWVRHHENAAFTCRISDRMYLRVAPGRRARFGSRVREFSTSQAKPETR